MPPRKQKDDRPPIGVDQNIIVLQFYLYHQYMLVEL